MKRALVTGGSGDIGQAICFALAKLGLEVLVHANSNLERANGVVSEIIKNGGVASSVCFDVTDQKTSQN